MKVKFLITYVILQVITNSYSFIIPDEIPSILSVIYSNIPTLKKGTDSRIGWGFRLGDRADFQVLLELGPQTNTQPLANQGGDGNSKRNTLNNLANTLYAQRLEEKKNKNREQAKEENSETQSWLHKWNKTNQENKQPSSNEISVGFEAKPGIAIGEIDAKSVLPDDSTLEKLEIEQLTKKRTKSNTIQNLK